MKMKPSLTVFPILLAGLLFSFLLSSCRHPVVLLREKSSVLEAHSKREKAYSFSYDAENGKLTVFRHDYLRTRERVAYEDAGVMSVESKCLAWTDFWMGYSLWSGNPRMNTEYLAIPPLCLYPVVDTLILTCCLVRDGIMFPFSCLGERKAVSPHIISDSEDRPSGEVLHQFTLGSTLYRDRAVNKVSTKLEIWPVTVRDIDREKIVNTDKNGAVMIEQLVRYPLPARKVTLVIDREAKEGKGVLVLETETLLTEDEKKTLGILNDIHVSARLKKEALNKLKARFRPDLYEREGRKRGLL